MNQDSAKPTPAKALDLRLSRGTGVDAVMGDIAIDSEDVALHVKSHRWEPSRRLQWLQELLPHWQSLPLSAGSRSALEKLQDPTCQIVMAGQQPALCGGPLLSTVKLLAATRMAADLEKRGIPAVALFWIADEDHDVGELDPGRFRNGVRMEVPFGSGRRPISELRHPGSETLRRQELEACLAGAPHAAEVLSILSGAFDPSPSVEFRNVLWSLLPDEEWLPIHPQWLRSLQKPWIEKAFADSESFQKDVLTASLEQQEAGIPAPVRPREGAPFFFINEDGERVRPETTTLTGADELLADPERLSADALLRGMIQDAIFEPAAVILGATEWCYNLQTRDVRKQWGISQPLWLPRPGLRPLESDRVKALAELGIGLERLVPGIDLTAEIPSSKGELKRMELMRASEDLFGHMQKIAEDEFSNPSLRKKARRMWLRWQRQLESLGKSVDQGLDVEVEAQRNRVRQLLDQVFPGGSEPERTRNLCDLLAWHGLESVQEMTATISGSIRRWDGRVSAWPLPTLNQLNESENSDESP